MNKIEFGFVHIEKEIVISRYGDIPFDLEKD